jgi:hypothetical protein
MNIIICTFTETRIGDMGSLILLENPHLHSETGTNLNYLTNSIPRLQIASAVMPLNAIN